MARRGITFPEVLCLVLGVLVVVAINIIALTTFKGIRRTPELQRLVCAANLKGIGTALLIYENDQNSFPIPGFDETKIGSIRYTVSVGGGRGNTQSPSRTQPSLSGPMGATELSTTRAFWMLVRSGEVTVHQFVCSATRDSSDSTLRIDSAYDFASLANVSYGYQVPFGHPLSRPRSNRFGADNRMILAADKGPYDNVSVEVPPSTVSATTPPVECRPYNSRNHLGEGQNVLFADGHVSFQKTPFAGVDSDNLYTAALGNTEPASWRGGESPWKQDRPPFLPTDQEGRPLASTDSLIYP